MDPYEVQLNINGVDGMLRAIQGSDLSLVKDFIDDWDHEGAALNMNIRDTPDSPLRSVYGEDVWKELAQWAVP